MYKFGDIFEFRKKSKVKAGEGEIKGKFPFYTSSNILNKYIDEYLFDGESLIFGTGGNASIHFARNNFNVSTDCLVAQTKNGNINTKFIYYFLLLNKHILERGFKGAGLKHISKSYISNISIPEVDRAEQDKIVQALDKVNALRQKRKEQLSLFDDYLKSVFLEMFGDNKKFPKKKIPEIVKNRKGSIRTGPFGSTLKHSEFKNEGPVAVLGIDNAVENEFKWKKLRFISNKKYQSLKKYTVYPGDVLITIMGTLGRSAVVPSNVPLSINTKHLACISLNTKIIDPYFFSYSIYNDPYILHQLKRNIHGAIMDGLNLSIIKDLNLFLPPTEIQRNFIEVKNSVDSIKQKMQESLNEMNDYFNSLMQRYFE
jgi:type I restriction enzyme S subunit